MTFYNSTFSNNQAYSGGGLVLTWSSNYAWYTVLNNVTFVNNTASVMGGAIYYDLFRPNMTNVIFKNNTSPYGPNIASYPVKIILSDSNSTNIAFDNAVSGQEQEVDLNFQIVDYDDQVALTTSSGRVIK